MDERAGWADWQRAEYAEQAYMASYLSGAGRIAADQVGMTVAELGGGVVWATKDDPSGGFLSRAVGQGVREPVTAAVLDELVDVAIAAGAPTIGLQPSPEVVTPRLSGLLAERGFAAGRTWDKLVRATVDPPEARTDLRVDLVGPELAEEYAGIMLAAFGLAKRVRPISRAQVGMPGWTTYGAFDGESLVAVAGMHVDGDIACLSGAATAAQSRGRGAQRALLARRITDAAAAGVRHLATETWSETDGAHNPSLHNMHWAGFRTLYRRTNYVRRLAD